MNLHSTPDSTPDSTTDSTPNSAPDSTPDCTLDSAHDSKGWGSKNADEISVFGSKYIST